MGPSVLINSALSRGEQTFCSDLNDSWSKKEEVNSLFGAKMKSLVKMTETSKTK